MFEERGSRAPHLRRTISIIELRAGCLPAVPSLHPPTGRHPALRPPPAAAGYPYRLTGEFSACSGGLTYCLLPPLVLDRSRCCWPPLSLLAGSAALERSRGPRMRSSTLLQLLSQPLGLQSSIPDFSASRCRPTSSRRCEPPTLSPSDACAVSSPNSRILNTSSAQLST